MKVAFSLTQCSHTVPGGTAVAALELRDALRALPDPVDVVAVGARGIGRQPDSSLPEPSVSFRLPYPALYDLWNRTDRGALDRLVPDADLAHLTMAFCPQRRGMPQLSMIHDVFPFSHPDLFTARGVKVMQAGMTRVLERADLIVTPSAASAERLVEHGGSAEQIRVVPHGATPRDFTDEEVAVVRERLGLPERFVMFAGTVEPRKNLDVLLAAMDEIDEDVVLALVGPTGWGEINERLNTAPSERVRVLGWQSREDLLALMSAASAVCMPSFAEGFGLPALEAMAQGTPVIHSECSALREVVGDTGSQVHSADVSGWATEMSAFVLDDDRSVEQGRAASKRAESFSWAQTATKMRSVYEELV